MPARQSDSCVLAAREVGVAAGIARAARRVTGAGRGKTPARPFAAEVREVVAQSTAYPAIAFIMGVA
jgi:hypothetical protein